MPLHNLALNINNLPLVQPDPAVQALEAKLANFRYQLQNEAPKEDHYEKWKGEREKLIAAEVNFFLRRQLGLGS